MVEIKYLSKVQFDYIDELLDRGYIGQWFVRAMRYNPKKLIDSYNDPNYENKKNNIQNIKGRPSLSTLTVNPNTVKVAVKDNVSKSHEKYKAMRRIKD